MNNYAWLSGFGIAILILVIIPAIRGHICWRRLKQESLGKWRYINYKSRLAKWNEEDRSNLRGSGWLLYVIERLFMAAEFASPFQMFGRNPHVNQMFVGITNAGVEAHSKRARRVDTYLFLFWVVEAMMIFLLWTFINGNDWLRGAVTAFIGARLFDIFQTTLNQSIFNNIRYATEWKTLSNQRNLVIALLSYLEVAALFGMAHSLLDSSVLVSVNKGTVLHSIYSTVSLKFDFLDTNRYGKLLVGVNILMNIELATIIIVRAINSLPRIQAIKGDNE